MSITSKDLQVLSSLLLINSCGNKKCDCHLEAMQDKQAKTKVDEVRDSFNQRFMELFEVLENN